MISEILPDQENVIDDGDVKPLDSEHQEVESADPELADHSDGYIEAEYIIKDSIRKSKEGGYAQVKVKTNAGYMLLDEWLSFRLFKDFAMSREEQTLLLNKYSGTKPDEATEVEIRSISVAKEMMGHEVIQRSMNDSDDNAYLRRQHRQEVDIQKRRSGDY